MSSHFTYRNWDRTLSCRPREFHQPSSIAEVIRVVRDAEATGSVVRVFGATHSWSSFVLTDDVLLNLDRLCHVVVIYPDNLRITVQAGIRIKDLVQVLHSVGLALPNVGSVMEQSIAGAISHGTHGTGKSIGCLHTQVVGMKIVSGGGEMLEISEADTDLLAAARVSLGALGVIVEVTLKCVPIYNVHLKAWPVDFDEALAQVDQLLDENQRVRFYWLPGAKKMYINTMNDTKETSTGTSPLVRWLRDRLLRHHTLALLMGIGDRFPSAIGAINRFEARVGYNLIDEIGPYFEQLPIGVSPLHTEMEYSVPIERTADAMRETRRIVEAHGNQATLPQEFRFAHSDNAMLSPAFGRDSCYVCAQTSNNELAAKYFRDFEPAMKEMGGRPHWGKVFTLTPAEAEKMYPRYHEFCQLRRRIDPKDTFASKRIRDLFI